MVAEIIPWILSCVTLTAMWLLGNKHIAGWVLGLANQVLWVMFIAMYEAWGLLPLSLALTVVYVRNIIKWCYEKDEKLRTNV
jgi:hypothetical protein